LLQQMFVYILCRQFLISVRKSVASNTSWNQHKIDIFYLITQFFHQEQIKM
jgi:hypothetical protein